MWMLVPLAFAGKLLSAFRKPLSSLWGSLALLLLWLRGRTEAAGSTGHEDEGDPRPLTPTSVNYHFTRQCNYKCGFCFHTAKTSFVLPLQEARRGLTLLREAGESPACPERRGRKGRKPPHQPLSAAEPRAPGSPPPRLATGRLGRMPPSELVQSTDGLGFRKQLMGNIGKKL